MKAQITTINGKVIEGTLVRQYLAYEGGMRYIFSTTSGDYRCVKDENGNYVELVI